VSTRARLVVLISGRGSNMAALARACAQSRIPAELALVVCDRPDAPGLKLAREHAIDTAVVPSQQLPRDEFERALIASIDAHAPQIIALAGFMRILSQPFVSHYAGRMLNIHPSLLPRHRGLHTHRRVLEAGEREHGASVHFVTAELDGGPVILQSRLRVRAGESEKELSARVQATEHIIYPRAVGWLAEGRLVWREERAWFDGRPLDAPIIEEFADATQV
jgi:phosphoribosylglycinamide formyltransferase-1